MSFNFLLHISKKLFIYIAWGCYVQFNLMSETGLSILDYDLFFLEGKSFLISLEFKAQIDITLNRAFSLVKIRPKDYCSLDQVSTFHPKPQLQ